MGSEEAETELPIEDELACGGVSELATASTKRSKS
jgi:hypothetical protein